MLSVETRIYNRAHKIVVSISPWRTLRLKEACPYKSGTQPRPTLATTTNLVTEKFKLNKFGLSKPQQIRVTARQYLFQKPNVH